MVPNRSWAKQMMKHIFELRDIEIEKVSVVYMTTTHGRALLLCMKFQYCTTRWRLSIKVYNLTLEEIETIISEATSTNTIGATAFDVFV